MNFGTVAILGPGLIGGSLALALAERSLADKLVIWARNEKSFPAIREKLPHATLTTDIIEAMRNADIVILCVPIETMKGLVEKFADSLKPTALVTDVGSVKESVDREIAPLLAGKALWIGSHPMAGSEQAGFAAARADLFVGAAVIITPTDYTQPEAERRAKQFWEALEGRVVCIELEFHDIVVAEVSHIPHLLAAFLVGKVTDEGRAIAGGGFRDTTRVASGSPELWTEILWANRDAIAIHLRAWKQWVSNLEGLLENTEPVQAKSELLRILKTAQTVRSQMLETNPLFKKR